MFHYGDIVEVLIEDHRYEGRVGAVIHQKGSRVTVQFAGDDVQYFYTSDLVKVSA